MKTKQIVAFILSLVMCLFLIACGATEEQPDSVDELVENETQVSSQPDSTDTDIGNETQENDQTEMAEENSDSEQQEVSGISEGQVFNLENGTVMLNSGYEMPILGIGTFRLSGSEAENSVYWALRDGYRLIDTARIYGNEADVGRGIQRAIDEGIVTREEIFVTTKMWTDDFDNGAEAINASLERLGLDYIDLLLLHQQVGDYMGAWRDMEKAVAQGKVKAIGLSNFESERLEEVCEAATIKPAVLQVECHPYFQQNELKKRLAPYGTVIEAWYPIGHGDADLINEPVFAKLAEKYGKANVQIILRWHIQEGTIVFPKSTNPEHIKDNFDIFDFELTKEEMERIRAVDKNVRFFTVPLEQQETQFTAWAPED